MTDAREQYLAAWQVLTELVDAIPPELWDAPTPCADWTVRELVGHVVDGARQVQAMTGNQSPPTPVQEPQQLAQVAGSDPAETTRRAVAALQRCLAELPTDAVVQTRAGKLALQQVFGMALIEPVVHGWDLATATGQQAAFTDDSVTTLLTGVRQMGEQLAATGMYREAEPLDEQAPALEQLRAALGRARPVDA